MASALVLSVFPLVGCASDKVDAVPAPGAADALLPASTVGSFGERTPEHALLAWWRNTQYDDVQGFRQGFADAVKQRLAPTTQLARSVAYFAGAIRTARPTIRSVERDGSARATVYTLIEYRRPLGSSKYVSATVPRAFVMVFQRGDWRLVDDYFVRLSLPHSLQLPG